MGGMDELTEAISLKAKQYVKETGTDIEKFPESIVEFVLEYVLENCHFPAHFTEEKILSTMSSRKSTLAMACADVFAKSGAEGQTYHSENGISRTYKTSWISSDLLSNFPNYVTFL